MRQYGVSYAQFIPSLNHSGVSLNRKVLSELAATEPFAFKAIVDTVMVMKEKKAALKGTKGTTTADGDCEHQQEAA